VSPKTDRPNLRSQLRTSTKSAHDALDATLGTLNLADRDEYCQFLHIQYAARVPLEQWCAVYMPGHLMPPRQSGLIAQDLFSLGSSTDVQFPAFIPAADIEPLGIAWALGGSSMGNRTMLARMRRHSGKGRPAAFLAGDAMQAFWGTIKPLLGQPVSDATTQRATRGAIAVFACFETAKTLNPTRITHPTRITA